MKIKELKGFPKKIPKPTEPLAPFCGGVVTGFNNCQAEIGDIEIEIDEEKMAKIIHGEVEPDGWTTKGSKDLAHTIAQQCPIKKKLDFIIPTAEQRERQEYEQGMRDEYKRAESDGYKTIR